jgi:hypothetical protein
MDAFRKISERKIREAIESGMFENLPGKGKRLVFEDETWIPEDLRIAYRFLKNAGYLPPEIELTNEIISLRNLIDTIDDNKERLKKLRELNYKMIKLDMMRQKPLDLGRFPEYERKITEKMIP